MHLKKKQNIWKSISFPPGASCRTADVAGPAGTRSSRCGSSRSDTCSGGGAVAPPPRDGGEPAGRRAWTGRTERFRPGSVSAEGNVNVRCLNLTSNVQKLVLGNHQRLVVSYYAFSYFLTIRFVRNCHIVSFQVDIGRGLFQQSIGFGRAVIPGAEVTLNSFLLPALIPSADQSSELQFLL